MMIAQRITYVACELFDGNNNTLKCLIIYLQVWESLMESSAKINVD